MSATVHGMFRCIPYESPIIVTLDPHTHLGPYGCKSQPVIKNIINISSSNTNCDLDNNGINIHCIDDNNTNNNQEICNNTDTYIDCHDTDTNIESCEPSTMLESLNSQGLGNIQTEVKKHIQESINILDTSNIPETSNIQEFVKQNIITEKTLDI